MMTQAQAKTTDGYIRVSRRMGREGPGYISKDVQHEAIAAMGLNWLIRWMEPFGHEHGLGVG